mgnify:CR=1 FL=1
MYGNFSRLASIAVAGVAVVTLSFIRPAAFATELAQATPMPSPAATTMPAPAPGAPAPNPAVTPAGNPPATAPQPGTDMLNSNPNGSAWLQKFNRVPTPEPNMSMPSGRMPMHGRMMMPATHPMIPARCRAMMRQAMMNGPITPAQHAKLKARCRAMMRTMP